jgi:hypothetical protein
MIEYYLQTGISLDSDNYYNIGEPSFGNSFIGNNNQFSNHIYINGQSLFEDNFVETSIAGTVVSTEHSGDFYLKNYSLNFSGSILNLSGINNLYYDIIESGKRPFYENNSFNSLKTGFSGQVSTNLDSDLVFINGIKLTSGQNYIENNNGNFEWIDSSENLGGIIFSMPNIAELIITGRYDIYNQYFKKGTTQAYLNGVKLYQEDDFLEISTLVNLIKTGISAEILFSPKSIETLIFF